MQFGTGSQGEGNVFIGKSGAQAAGFISENFAEARFAERDASGNCQWICYRGSNVFYTLCRISLAVKPCCCQAFRAKRNCCGSRNYSGKSWTFPLIWYITLHIGLFVLGADAPQLPVDFKALFTELFHTVIGLDFSAFLEDIWPVFYPMLIGSIPLYIVVWWSVSRMAWRVLLNNPAKTKGIKMILGLGCDIVQVSRFSKNEAFLLRFIKKYFTFGEIAELEVRTTGQDLSRLVLAVATRFAAKEAVSKALGSGFREGITLKDVEIVHDSLGCPKVNLYGKALTRAYFISKNQNFNMHLTLSNEREYVSAVAVMESL